MTLRFCVQKCSLILQNFFIPSNTNSTSQCQPIPATLYRLHRVYIEHGTKLRGYSVINVAIEDKLLPKLRKKMQRPTDGWFIILYVYKGKY